jgi:hypothetical protein
VQVRYQYLSDPKYIETNLSVDCVIKFIFSLTCFDNSNVNIGCYVDC